MCGGRVGDGSGVGSQKAGTGSPLQEVLWSGASYSLKNTVVLNLLSGRKSSQLKDFLKMTTNSFSNCESLHSL